MASFVAILFTVPGKGGWTFAPVPEAHAPPTTGPWGMTPVLARVDGRSWATSVWRDKTRGVLLPVPAKIRQRKSDGDSVEVEIVVDPARSL